jgi:hypothetical protein
MHETDLSELRKDLEALRREVAELRAGRQSTASSGSPQDMVRSYLGRKLTAEAASVARTKKEGKIAGAGVFRIVALHQDPSRNYFMADEPCFYDAASLPPEQKLVDLGAALNPLAARAVYEFLRAFFDGQPMPLCLMKSELAASLETTGPDLDNALRLSVANRTMRWGKTAEGDEYYEMVRPDTFVLLLGTVARL